MQVISVPGTKCPKEGKPREYIDDKTEQTVPDTAYYRRLVNDGSLLEMVSQTVEVNKNKKGGKD